MMPKRRYWKLDALDVAHPLDEQVGLLCEDLAQVAYGPDVLLDVGWYPEHDLAGCFRVLVVKHEDWCNPLFDHTARSVLAMRAVLEIAALVAEAAAGSTAVSYCDACRGPQRAGATACPSCGYPWPEELER